MCIDPKRLRNDAVMYRAMAIKVVSDGTSGDTFWKKYKNAARQNIAETLNEPDYSDLEALKKLSQGNEPPEELAKMLNCLASGIRGAGRGYWNGQRLKVTRINPLRYVCNSNGIIGRPLPIGRSMALRSRKRGPCSAIPKCCFATMRTIAWRKTDILRLDSLKKGEYFW